MAHRVPGGSFINYFIQFTSNSLLQLFFLPHLHCHLSKLHISVCILQLLLQQVSTREMTNSINGYEVARSKVYLLIGLNDMLR